ncbi:MAG: sigma-70 family RNA polymerase sigma factor [Gemmatimonadetes bacterium]|nr:sigma-70 family RNA polymerase sigma factor [Gemmatimonadota bacterium]
MSYVRKRAIRNPSPGELLEESQLIERVLNGDPVAERQLYDAHVDRVYRLAYRMTGEDDLAQECTQEAFIRAFDRLSQFRGDAAFSTWLHSITVSVVYNVMRKVTRLRNRHVEMDETLGLSESRNAAEPDLKGRLAAAIDELPQGYKTVFVMHDIEGYKHDEIAQALGVRTGTSKAQLSRARAKLREALADFAEEWAS